MTGGPVGTDDELVPLDPVLGGAAWFVDAAQDAITSEQARAAAKVTAANGLRTLMMRTLPLAGTEAGT